MTNCDSTVSISFINCLVVVNGFKKWKEKKKKKKNQLFGKILWPLPISHPTPRPKKGRKPCINRSNIVFMCLLSSIQMVYCDSSILVVLFNSLHIAVLKLE